MDSSIFNCEFSAFMRAISALLGRHWAASRILDQRAGLVLLLPLLNRLGQQVKFGSRLRRREVLCLFVPNHFGLVFNRERPTRNFQFAALFLSNSISIYRPLSTQRKSYGFNPHGASVWCHRT